MPVGIPFAFYFCLITYVRNSETIRSQKGKKNFLMFFIKYLWASCLESTDFQRICFWVFFKNN